jgi:hypothetical protein
VLGIRFALIGARNYATKEKTSGELDGHSNPCKSPEKTGYEEN